MHRQWKRYPPLPILIAHYLGAAKPEAAADAITDLAEQDVLPAQRLSASEFDQLLASMKLPTGAP
jgi:hypothetical protein